jgi:hypothetical protein
MDYSTRCQAAYKSFLRPLSQVFVCGVGVIGVVVVVVDTSWFYFRQLFFCDGTIKTDLLG